MYLFGQIVATFIILCWIAQGWHTADMTLRGPYASIWGLLIYFFTVMLLAPLYFIWF